MPFSFTFCPYKPLENNTCVFPVLKHTDYRGQQGFVCAGRILLSARYTVRQRELGPVCSLSHGRERKMAVARLPPPPLQPVAVFPHSITHVSPSTRGNSHGSTAHTPQSIGLLRVHCWRRQFTHPPTVHSLTSTHKMISAFRHWSLEDPNRMR